MARIGIAQQQVLKIAQELVAAGEMPTAARIRAILKTGSLATIQRHLDEWKKDCFIRAERTAAEGISPIELEALVEKNRILEQSLNQQMGKIGQFSSELMNAEKELLKLKEENQQLNSHNLELQEALKKMSMLKDTFEMLYQEIKAERDSFFEKVTREKNQIIEELKEEIKMINGKYPLKYHA